MCADFTSEEIRLGAKIVWLRNFPQWLIELTMKDVSGFYYEIP